MQKTTSALLVLFLSSVPAWMPCAADETLSTAANVMVELEFKAAIEHDDPFNTVELDAVFTDPAGRTYRVPGFWAGGRVWRVRYASPVAGIHDFRTLCSVNDDQGLHDVTGRLKIVPYSGDNPLFRHGPIRVAADRRHFEHADGTPFLWIGDTAWMGLCKRLHWPDEFKQLLADRRQKGFNVIQIVAGLYPDMPAFDPRGANQAGFPWEKDYSAIRPAYFDRADERLAYMAQAGFVPCIVGAWGYHMPWMGPDRLKKHWRYLVARYGALPVVWCIAGEVNLPYYLTKGFPFEDKAQVTAWTEVAAYVQRINPFDRMISIHPTGLGRLSARATIDDVTLLDFDMLQTGHGDVASLEPTVRAALDTRSASPTMPFINSEVCYEGILDSCHANVQRLMVWTCLMCGAAGHTYGANGIWQLNRRDQPYGKSPHGGDYDGPPWDQAMQLPGSFQVGLAGKILDRYPWHRFEPHPEWATFVTSERKVKWGDWIWFPEGKPAQDAPAEARCFRRTFELPEGQTAAGAVLRVGCDDQCTVWLNGRQVGSQRAWRPAGRFAGIDGLLGPGRNVLAVKARNLPAPVEKNPAGLICHLDIELADGSLLEIVSDPSWKASRTADPGWQNLNFDDSAWPDCMVVAKPGDGPWGEVSAKRNPFLRPYSAGTPDGRVRMFYFPTAERTMLHKLDPGKTYGATWFDPITGRPGPAGTAKPDEHGSWPVPGAPKSPQDWVLVLQENHAAAAAK